MRFDVYHIGCDFSDCCSHLYCVSIHHNKDEKNSPKDLNTQAATEKSGAMDGKRWSENSVFLSALDDADMTFIYLHITCIYIYIYMTLEN